jgi:plasmid stabilization system protein ParE
MVKTVIWTLGAQYDRKDILDYWTLRNQSPEFSIKLNARFEHAIQYIAKHPDAGRLTNLENIRTVLVLYYLIIYEINTAEIYILSIWDGRQNPEKPEARLK